jgi:nitroreductase
MNTIEAIYARRSLGKVKSEPVPRNVIERLLGAAVQAPNHYNVRPWRFVVLTGAGLSRLGDVMADVLQRRFPDLEESALQKERSKPLRAPLIIAVGADEPKEPRVKDVENICAAAAAAENILLAAQDLGLAGYWRTGDAALDEDVKGFLGLNQAQHLIGFLYLGYPAGEPDPQERPGFEDRTTWIE